MATATTRRASREGTEVGRRATREAREVASTAAERGGELASVAKEGTRDIAATVAGSVKEQAGEVAGQLAGQGRSLVEETRELLQEQARVRTEKVADNIRQWGEQAQALAEGRPEDAPALSEYVWRAADGAYGTADRLYAIAQDVETRGVSGVLDDLQTFARRRPGAFLLGAAAVGFGVARLVKSQSSDEDEEEEAPPARARGTTARTPPTRTRAAR